MADADLGCVGGFACGPGVNDAQYVVCSAANLFDGNTRSCQSAAGVACNRNALSQRALLG